MDQGILVLIFVLSFSVSTKEAGRCGKLSDSCGQSSYDRSITVGGGQTFRGPIKIHIDISIDVGGTGRYHHCRKFQKHHRLWKQLPEKHLVQYYQQKFHTNHRHHQEHSNMHHHHRYSKKILRHRHQSNFNKHCRNHRHLNKHHRYHRHLKRHHHHRIFDKFEEYGHSHRHVIRHQRELNKLRKLHHKRSFHTDNYLFGIKKHKKLYGHRHHVVHHNRYTHWNLRKHTHRHMHKQIHLFTVGHKPSHLGVDKRNFDREWHLSRHTHVSERQQESQITEHHESSGLIVAGHYFKRFHQLGVRLIGRGIVYHTNFYKLRCSERRFYISMKKCIRTYGGIDACFPRLYGRGLIGKRHRYKRYGHGFGLGVKFVRKGIIYGKYYLKYHVVRKTFIKYMTVCVNKRATWNCTFIWRPKVISHGYKFEEYGQSHRYVIRHQRELYKLRKLHQKRSSQTDSYLFGIKKHKKLYGHRHHVVHHNHYTHGNLRKHTHHHMHKQIHLSTVGHKPSHLSVDKRNFDREWHLSRHTHVSKRQQESQITEHHERSGLTIAGHYFKRFHQLGVRLIGRGIVYHTNFYKLRCSERRLYISMRKCIRTYGGIDACFPRLYGRGLIGKRHRYKRYGHGFGLGVKFVRKGIIYGRYYLKYHVVRKTFIKYMTVCVNSYGRTSKCIKKLQKKGLLGTANSYGDQKVISHGYSFEEYEHSHRHVSRHQRALSKLRHLRHKHGIDIVNHGHHAEGYLRIPYFESRLHDHHSKIHHIASHKWRNRFENFQHNYHAKSYVNKKRIHHIINHNYHHLSSSRPRLHTKIHFHKLRPHTDSYLQNMEKHKELYKHRNHVVHHDRRHVVHYNRHHVVHYNRHHIGHHNRRHFVHYNPHHVLHNNHRHVVHHNRHHVVHHNRRHVVHQNRHHVVHHNRRHFVHHNRHHLIHHNRRHVVHHNRQHVVHYNRRHVVHHNRHHLIHHNRRHEVHHNRHHVVHPNRRHFIHHNRHVVHHSRRYVVHHNRRHFVHHNHRNLVHYNRNHVVHHNHYKQENLHKHTHRHIHKQNHLSALGHEPSHLAVDRHNFDREWHMSRHTHVSERQQKSQITEHNESSGLTIAGHYFKRFHQLGVRLIGRGIVYHHTFYKLRCSEKRLYISMKKCIRTYGGVEPCFPRLYGRGLIGKRHRYKRYGHGFGLGVKFVRKGIVYENYYLKYHVVRKTFIKYMTVCVNSNGRTSKCINKLQKKGLLGTAHSYRNQHVISHNFGSQQQLLQQHSASTRPVGLHHNVGYRHIHAIKEKKRTFRRYRKLGVRLVGQGILFNGYFYRIRVDYNIVYRTLCSCMRSHGGVHACLPVLYKKSFIGTRHRFMKYGRGYGLGIKFVRRGIVFIENILHKQRIIGHAVTWRGKHMFQRVASDHLVIHRSSPNYGHVHGIKVDKRIFRLYRKLGVHLVGQGITYHGYFFRFSIDYNVFYKILRSCIRTHGGIRSCFQYLHKKELIGRRHRFQKYNSGYGLGIKFVRRGIVYQKHFYKFLIRRRTIVRYMTTCIHSYHEAGVCLNQLRKQGLIEHAVTWRGKHFLQRVATKHLVLHRRSSNYGHVHGIKVDKRIFRLYRKLGVHLVGQGITYHGYFFRFSMGYSVFYKILRSCIRTHGGIRSCFQYLHKKELIGRRHRFQKYNRGYGLGIKFVRRGIVYQKHFYKFLIRRRRFVRYMTTCIHSYHHADVCLTQLHKQRIIGNAVKWRGKHILHRGQLKKYGHHRHFSSHQLALKDLKRFKHKYGIEIFKHSVIPRRLNGHLHTTSHKRRKHFRMVQKRILREQIRHHTHKHAHLSALGHGRHHLAIHGHNYQTHGHLSRQMIESHSEQHKRSDLTIAGHYFKRFHKLGVRLIGRGIVYHKNFYKLRCTERKLYISMKKCIRTYGGVGACFPRLYGRGLLGKRHRYKRYGRGFGLGVKFVRKGIVYENYYLKYHVVRKTFIKYMTVCVNSKGRTSKCIDKLQDKGLLGSAHSFEVHQTISHNSATKHQFVHHNSGFGHIHNIIVDKRIFRRYRKLGVRLVGQGILFKGYFYRIRVDYTIVYKTLWSCMRKHNGVGACLRILYKKAFIGSQHRFTKYGKGYGLGIKFVRRGIVYKEHFYKFMIRRRRFIRMLLTWRGKHMLPKVTSEHLVLHRSSSEYGHIHNIKVDKRIFRLYRKLGVRLVGQGILYHKNFYKIHVDYKVFFKTLRSCIWANGGIRNCLPNLYKKQLIGRRYRFKKFGLGYGLGIKFVRRGIVHRKHFYKFLIRRRRFVRYMTTCIHEYKHPGVCITQLQKQRILGHASIQRKKHGYHRKLIKVTHRRFSYDGQVYRLTCRRRRFYRKWSRCMRMFHNKDTCFRQLHSLFILYSEGHEHHDAGHTSTNIVVSPIFKRFRKLGVSLVGRGILYHRYYYKLRCEYTKFYTILRQCERSHGRANVCISRMFRRKLIGRRHKFKRFGYGFGLGVKFVQKGVVYKHSFYKFLIKRRLFIGYMTTCFNEYGNTKSCMAKLGKQGIIGAAQKYKEETKQNMSLTTLLHGINPKAHHFVYKGSAFKLRCSVKRFYRLWRHCKRKHHNVFVCFSRLHGLFKPTELHGHGKFGQGIIGYGGIKMVHDKNNVAHETFP
ncbi:unnamed protein product [Mytilus coruscus]|uniref:Uncharacterized protein n=1 Tax=Mytilus coruscus TaxID=42192 RepID=A0A6J8ACV9_MYTCO|nr:unnamed protein product [Mytilus coruscus]